MHNCDLMYDLPAKSVIDITNSSEKDFEIFWNAGRIAFLCESEKSLSDNFDMNVDFDEKLCKSLYLSKNMKNGTILKPSKEWLQDVKRMEQLFLVHHPQNGIRKRSPGLKSDFVKILKYELPHRPIRVLEEFVSLRTKTQLKLHHAYLKEKKRATLRGSRKNAQFGC